MNRLLLIGLGLMAFSGAAGAACSTSSMAGTWRMIGQSNVCQVTLSPAGAISGVSCSDGKTYAGTISLNSSCVLSGTIAGTAIKGRTNPIAPSAATAPTMVTAASSNGKIAFTGFRL